MSSLYIVLSVMRTEDKELVVNVYKLELHFFVHIMELKSCA